MTITYSPLGSGVYNTAYLVHDDSRIIGVFKEQMTQEPTALGESPSAEEIIDEETTHGSISLDTVERSIKIWNEINPTKPAREFYLTIDGSPRRGWLCPYVEGKQASDTAISHTLIDIYQRTGRIVIDAIGANNIITQNDGESVCIDIGMAMKLDNEYGPLPRVRNTKHHGDREDMPGLIQWRALQLSTSSGAYFDHPHYTQYYPHSVMVIKSLLFINRHRPELKNVDFLFNRETAAIIATAYNEELYNPTTSQTFISEALASIEESAVNVNIEVAALQSSVHLYLKHLEKKLTDNKIGYITGEALIMTKRLSPMQEKLITRYNTILDLDKTIGKPHLNPADIRYSKKAILACAANKPYWTERPFFQQLTDFLSLGARLLCRTFFSKEPKLQKTIENTIKPNKGSEQAQPLHIPYTP